MVVEANTHEVIPPGLAVVAMRDSGYKNTAYALAELIDNSIQAEASTVEVLCAEKEFFRGQRMRRQVQQIAVLDNGTGMTGEKLRAALQFGNGEHRTDRAGIGRFGMGLPNSSISQCKRVDVWSWQSGTDSAIHSYLDIAEMEEGKLRSVPEPKAAPIPAHWLSSGENWGPSGTLVVWSNLDRCNWRMATTIFKNSEFLIGRMYRRFLDDGRTSIRFRWFIEDTPGDIIDDRLVVLNDPLYLMAPSSCPAPYDKTPMFEPWGERSTEVIQVPSIKGEMHDVTIRYSYAKLEARKGYDAAGSSAYGRHAGNNIGISIMREGRELELSSALTIAYDPRERWWGVEVEFPSALDEVFGVTNNKQAANTFTEIAKVAKSELDEFRLEDESRSQALDRMREEGDPSVYLLEVAISIDNFLTTIRDWIKQQTKGSRPKDQRHVGNAEVHGTKVTEERIAAGHTAAPDADWEAPAEERVKAISDELHHELGISEEDAQDTAENLILGDVAARYAFTHSSVDTPAFFTVKPSGGVYLINLNISHPAYDYLIEVLEDAPEDASAGDLRRRLDAASDGLKLLFMAWARYESEQPPGTALREAAQDVRTDWGRLARSFLKKGA